MPPRRGAKYLFVSCKNLVHYNKVSHETDSNHRPKDVSVIKSTTVLLSTNWAIKGRWPNSTSLVERSSCLSAPPDTLTINYSSGNINIVSATPTWGKISVRFVQESCPLWKIRTSALRMFAIQSQLLFSALVTELPRDDNWRQRDWVNGTVVSV